MLAVTPPLDLLAANPQPTQIASQQWAAGPQEVNQAGPQSEEARLHLSLSGDNLLSSSELALEALFPLYQAGDQTLFVQGRVGKRRAQTILNLGVGQRWLMNQEWLLGYNLFYDTLRQQGRHSRVGVGLEARQEYFGMAINGYYPVSRWHKSSSYSRRPARGMDVILHANLPAYPQLGASIKGEHYWDKGVQLHNQYHGRSALTLGVNYTPISLVSAGYDYKIAKKGFKNQYQVHLTLNYRLGIPLAQQLDSSQVAPFRSLSSRLLEPVQRTNQMVLARRLESKANQIKQKLVAAGALKDEFSAFLDSLDSLPKEEADAALERLTNLLSMGRDATELAGALLVLGNSWPADHQLVIVSGDIGRSATGEKILLNGVEVRRYGEGQQVIKMRYSMSGSSGHYELMAGNVVLTTAGGGNCFYNAFLMARGKTPDTDGVQRLREEITRTFLRNPEIRMSSVENRIRAWEYR